MEVEEEFDPRCFNTGVKYAKYETHELKNILDEEEEHNRNVWWSDAKIFEFN